MGCDSISWCECSKVSIGYVKKILKFFWVHPIKHTFLVFKQHYTYFHIFFHPHVFTHMFSNNKIHVFKHMYQTPLKKVRIDNEINLIEAQHFFFFFENLGCNLDSRVFPGHEEWAPTLTFMIEFIMNERERSIISLYSGITKNFPKYNRNQLVLVLFLRI